MKQLLALTLLFNTMRSQILTSRKFHACSCKRDALRSLLITLKLKKIRSFIHGWDNIMSQWEISTMQLNTIRKANRLPISFVSTSLRIKSRSLFAYATQTANRRLASFLPGILKRVVC